MTRVRKRLPRKRKHLPTFGDDPRSYTGSAMFDGLPLPPVFTRKDLPPARRINYNGVRLRVPPFLDRRNWTKEDYEAHERIWQYVRNQELSKKTQRNLSDAQIFGQVKRKRHHKVLREHRRRERAKIKAEKRERKLQRAAQRERHEAQVLAALVSGDDTVGKVCKRTDLTTKYARRALRRLVKKGLVNKPSARRYVLVKRRRRKRLADVLK